MNILEEFKENITKETIIHKIEHSFIKVSNGKTKKIRGSTEYIIIDETGKNEPIKINKQE